MSPAVDEPQAEKRTARMTIAVTPEERARYFAAAAREGLPVSIYLRRILTGKQKPPK